MLWRLEFSQQKAKPIIGQDIRGIFRACIVLSYTYAMETREVVFIPKHRKEVYTISSHRLGKGKLTD